MTLSFATGFDALSDWRAAVREHLDALARFLDDHDLADAPTAAQLAGLRDRLGSDKLVVAFVAEFSRGKSELINAIFFSDAGQRVLPATPGRTTMCPVELAWDAAEPPSLRLLPIETRSGGLSLGELRAQRRAWTDIALDPADPARLAGALHEVTRTQAVPIDEARSLGFWDDARGDENPSLRDDGQVDLPVWRHALINYPHPLLREGLVVLDTPGLNAIGAEPELTLSLLPSAHATVFVLGADTGVTKSDLGLWRDHLGSPALTRFVVLNKVDTLADPLGVPAQTAAHVLTQRLDSARRLGVPPERVFALSAREALAARIGGNDAVLAQSGLPELEAAFAAELLPRRREVLGNVVHGAAQQIEAQVARRLADRRRQLAEQMLELRGLRGKSAAKLRLMLQRVETETAEFEECNSRLLALRSVHGRMLKEVLGVLSAERLRDDLRQALAAMTSSLLNLGARRAFVAWFERLRAVLGDAHRRGTEIRDMLGPSYARLNAEFGFSLVLDKRPAIDRFVDDLAPIERDFLRYLGPTQLPRLSSTQVIDPFRRALMARLRIIFEGASGEIDLWSRHASAQLESQLRERRRSFQSRREALERIQAAASELELRIAEMEAQDQRLQASLRQVHSLAKALQGHAQPMAEPAAAARAEAADTADAETSGPAQRRLAQA